MSTPSRSTACAIDLRAGECDEPFAKVADELARELGRNAWAIARPTIVMMLVASLAASALLTLLPLDAPFAAPVPLRMLAASVISVFMPVPIALDVMVAAHAHAQGAPPGYVRLLLMTLGTYSIMPTIYLWRDVSKRLALFVFFVVMGVPLRARVLIRSGGAARARAAHA